MKKTLSLIVLFSVLTATTSVIAQNDNHNMEEHGAGAMAPSKLFTLKKKHPSVVRLYGETSALGDGHVKTWVEVKKKSFHRIGFTLTSGALDLSALPTSEGHHDVHLKFPQLVGSPYDHAYFSWNPHGHAPSTVYDKPHYDFHLSFVSIDLLSSIAFSDPEGQILPSQGYMPEHASPQQFPDGSSYVNVPGQGVHWYYNDAPEWNGGSFTETFLWGSYNGLNLFMEPMMSHQTLVSVQNFEKSIELPMCVVKPGYYATTYGWKHKYKKSGELYIEVYMSDFVYKDNHHTVCQ